MAERKKECCVECGGPDVVREIEDYTFPYAPSPDTVDLTVKVPVYKCQNPGCGFQWLNWEAEQIMDNHIKEVEKTLNIDTKTINGHKKEQEDQ